MYHTLSAEQMIGLVFILFLLLYVCALCCKYVPFNDSSLSICVTFCQGTNDWLCFLLSILLYVCPLCCKDVPSFDSSLSICVIFCQVDKQLTLFFIFHFILHLYHILRWKSIEVLWIDW